MTYLDYLEQKVLLERLVIGLEEPVLIKGLGELSAKIDSGNGGYNVIHGTDFHQQGNELMFTTHDSFGHEKKMQATIIDTIEVNMGGGNIENRPVIELDIKFAGEDYKKIPFSVSDRSSNSNPILISKGFVENELEALIDVSAMNISNDGIEVVYGEGVGSFLKNVAKGAGSVMKGAGKLAGKGLWGAVKTAASGVKNAGKWMKGNSDVSLIKGVTSMGKDIIKAGVGAAGLVAGPIAGVLYGVCKAIHDPSKLVSEDTPALKKMLPNAVLHRQLMKNKNIILDGTIWKEYGKTNFKKLQITPIVSFKGRTGDVNKGHIISGMEERIKNWKKALSDAEKITKNSKGTDIKKNTAEEQEENVFREAYMILFEDTTTEGTISGDPNAGTTTPTTTTPTTQTTPTDNSQPNDTTQNTQENKEEEMTVSQEESNSIKETATDFKELSNFIIYFIPASTEKASESVSEITKIFTDGKLDQFLSKLFNIGQISKSSITPIIKDLAKTLKGLVQSKEVQGCFAIGTGDLGKRKVELFDDVDVAVYKTKEDESQIREGQTADPEIIKLAQEKFQNLDPLLDDVFSAIKDVNVLRLTSPQCKRQMRQVLVKSGGDLTKEREWVDKNISPYEKNGELPTAIVKNFLISNGLTEISSSIEKKYGKNWRITNFDDFINKIAEIDGISDLLGKIEGTSTPQPQETKSPKFDAAEQQITDQIDNQEQTPDAEVQPEEVETQPTEQQPVEGESTEETPEAEVQPEVTEETPDDEVQPEEPEVTEETKEEEKSEQDKEAERMLQDLNNNWNHESEEEPADLWVKQKLNYLKKKGLI